MSKKHKHISSSAAPTAKPAARPPVAKYDATESNRFRRQSTVETQSESGIYDITKRLLGCNLGRDLERNYSPAKSLLHQLRVNVVGSLGKLTVNMQDESGKEATDWFNEVWAKDCDYRDNLDWSTMLQNILISEHRDGDMLAVVDDKITPEDTGKLLTWESDQILPVQDDLITPLAAKYKMSGKIVQDSGIMRNEWGRIIGYATTGKRGIRQIANIEDATIWLRDNARLARNPWRLNQGRGVPSIITASTNFVDLYEILASELQSAKRASKQYAYVKRSDAITDWDDPTADPKNGLPENDLKDTAAVAEDAANQAAQSSAQNYERIEALTGGLIDYIDAKDDVVIPQLNHPSAAITAFLEAVHGYSGASLGIARAYTILRADSSYTAFRGDMILTWVTFYWLQKHLERVVADWVAFKVLTWGIRKKAFKTPTAGWERKLSWQWPSMPEVNELDAQNAITAALKNGTTDFKELLGPDWQRKLQGLAEQFNIARALNIPLSALETVSGALVDAGNKKKEKDNAKE